MVRPIPSPGNPPLKRLSPLRPRSAGEDEDEDEGLLLGMGNVGEGAASGRSTSPSTATVAVAAAGDTAISPAAVEAAAMSAAAMKVVWTWAWALISPFLNAYACRMLIGALPIGACNPMICPCRRSRRRRRTLRRWRRCCRLRRGRQRSRSRGTTVATAARSASPRRSCSQLQGGPHRSSPRRAPRESRPRTASASPAWRRRRSSRTVAMVARAAMDLDLDLVGIPVRRPPRAATATYTVLFVVLVRWRCGSTCIDRVL